MKDPNSYDNPGGEDRNEMEESSSSINRKCSHDGPETDRDVDHHDLQELRMQNIALLRTMLDDLLGRYEKTKTSDENTSTGGLREMNREIRLLMKLMDSLISSLQNPKNRVTGDELLTEFGATTFTRCVDVFAHSVCTILTQEFGADGQEKAMSLLNRIVEEFDDAFREFGTCDAEEETSHE